MSLASVIELDIFCENISSAAIRRAFDAKHAAKRRGASGDGECFVEGNFAPPPSPSAASARYDFVDSITSGVAQNAERCWPQQHLKSN